MIKILVPVNFSDYSINALSYALTLSEKFQAGITILHCFSDYASRDIDPDNPNTEEPMLPDIERHDRESQERLKKLTNKVITNMSSLQNKNIHIEYRFEYGYPEEVITQISKSMRSDVIIMGTSSKNDPIKQAMGSVTGDVINRTKALVLAVPANSRVNHLKIGNILFLMEETDRDFITLHRLIRITKPFNTRIYAVYHTANKEDKKDQRRIEEMRRYCENNCKHQPIEFSPITGKNFVATIKTYAKNNQIDLITMSSHKRTILKKFFTPSVTKKMLYETDVPLLIFQS